MTDPTLEPKPGPIAVFGAGSANRDSLKQASLEVWHDILKDPNLLAEAASLTGVPVAELAKAQEPPFELRPDTSGLTGVEIALWGLGVLAGGVLGGIGKKAGEDLYAGGKSGGQKFAAWLWPKLDDKLPAGGIGKPVPPDPETS